jgi:hypothetical protein
MTLLPFQGIDRRAAIVQTLVPTEETLIPTLHTIAMIFKEFVVRTNQSLGNETSFNRREDGTVQLS